MVGEQQEQRGEQWLVIMLRQAEAEVTKGEGDKTQAPRPGGMQGE